MKQDSQRQVANYMGALAHALGGRPERHLEFIDKVELILSGDPPNPVQLMRFADRVRTSGRPLLWIHHSEDVPTIPDVGLVARAFGTVHVFENCAMHLAADDDRIRLVPDNFRMGAFRFDDELRLRHTARAPAVSYDAAQDRIVDAYVRLRRIEAEQLDRGDVFALPQLVTSRLAA